ncbi:hypothetical protein [Phyllobacterium leguminum]|uniref:hypothetical protein n=1 Tax=Phyllobacterium leguminum TaxID=314237 RepID=UPI0015E8B37C
MFQRTRAANAPHGRYYGALIQRFPSVSSKADTGAFIQRGDTPGALRIGGRLHDSDGADSIATRQSFRDEEIGMRQQKTAGAELQDAWLFMHGVLSPPREP